MTWTDRVLLFALSVTRMSTPRVLGRQPDVRVFVVLFDVRRDEVFTGVNREYRFMRQPPLGVSLAQPTDTHLRSRGASSQFVTPAVTCRHKMSR